MPVTSTTNNFNLICIREISREKNCFYFYNMSKLLIYNMIWTPLQDGITSLSGKETQQCK